MRMLVILDINNEFWYFLRDWLVMVLKKYVLVVKFYKIFKILLKDLGL